MKETNIIKNVLRLLGFNEEKNSSRTLIFRITSIIMFFGAVMKIFKTWNFDIIKRFTAIKDLSVIVSSFVLYVEIVFVPRNIWSLMKIIDKDFFKTLDNLKIKLSNEKINLIIRNKTSQKFYLKITLCMILSISIISVFLPIFIVIYLNFTKNDGDCINYQDVPLPSDFWIPEKFSRSVIVFLSIHFLSSLNYTLIGFYAFTVFGTFTATAKSIIIDLKLYCVSLKEIDKYVVINYFNDDKLSATNYEHYNADRSEEKPFFSQSTGFNNKIDLKKLKSYVKYLLKQYNLICR